MRMVFAATSICFTGFAVVFASLGFVEAGYLYVGIAAFSGWWGGEMLRP